MQEPKSNMTQDKREVQLSREYQKEILDRRQKRLDSSVSVKGKYVPPRRELIEQYAPECIDRKERVGNTMKVVKKATHHAFFAPLEDRMSYIRKGYEPVLDKRDSFVMRDGDVLMRIPVELKNDLIADMETQHTRRLEGMTLQKDMGDAVVPKEEVKITKE